MEYFYLNFMSYQWLGLVASPHFRFRWHLYVSIMLLMVNLLAQLCVVLLEMTGAQWKDIVHKPFYLKERE